jgi:hypothetical protein
MRSIAMPVFLIPEDYINAFWYHNLEIRIGLQGLSLSGLRHEVGLGPA